MPSCHSYHHPSLQPTTHLNSNPLTPHPLPTAGVVDVPLPYPVSHLHISKQVHPDMPLKASNRSGVYSANTLLREHSRRLLQGQVHGVETPIVGPDGALYIVDASQTVREAGGCCLVLHAATCCLSVSAYAVASRVAPDVSR